MTWISVLCERSTQDVTTTARFAGYYVIERARLGGRVTASTSDRFRSMVAQPVTNQSIASETDAGLRLNMLPVVFPNEIQRDVVYSLPYTQEVCRAAVWSYAEVRMSCWR
jgi:hypothetical protein